MISASKADGAHESGLTALIWNQVLSYGTDAMITVALAGTVFFGASTHAQRGNVLLYLLITMAPFAVIAPVIGPALDRVQHGRRWTMAGTAIGRAVLALIMAGHPTELLVLYPCALGSLVLSKAYAVVRAAAAPRLVPQGMTLTEANARLTIFGLGSTLVLGGAGRRRHQDQRLVQRRAVPDRDRLRRLRVLRLPAAAAGRLGAPRDGIRRSRRVRAPRTGSRRSAGCAAGPGAASSRTW